ARRQTYSLVKFFASNGTNGPTSCGRIRSNIRVNTYCGGGVARYRQPMSRFVAALAVMLLAGCTDANAPVETAEAFWANGTGHACADDAPAVNLPPDIVAT